MTAAPEGELPIRIFEEPGGSLVIRCLCGAEAARAAGRLLAEDISPAALIRMILHAKKCKGGNR